MRLIFTMMMTAAMTVASPAMAQSKIAPGKLVQLNGIAMHYEERGKGATSPASRFRVWDP